MKNYDFCYKPQNKEKLPSKKDILKLFLGSSIVWFLILSDFL